MKLCKQFGPKNRNWQAAISYLIIIPLLAAAGCSPQGDKANNNTNSSNSVAIPVSIQTLDLPTDTATFTAKLFLDSGTSPIANSTIATDGTQTTVSFDNIVVGVGTHTFSVQFELETTTYGTTILVMISDPITVTAGSSHTLNFDIANYNFPDDDNDLVSNFDEVGAGTPPNDNVCYLGVSILGHCSVGT